MQWANQQQQQQQPNHQETEAQRRWVAHQQQLQQPACCAQANGAVLPQCGAPQSQPTGTAQAQQPDAPKKLEAMRQWHQRQQLGQQVPQQHLQGAAHDGLRNHITQQQLQLGHLQSQHHSKPTAQRQCLQQPKQEGMEQQGRSWAEEEERRVEATQRWMQQHQERESKQSEQQAQQRRMQEQQTLEQEKQQLQQQAALANQQQQQLATEQADRVRSQGDQARLHAHQTWSLQQMQDALERAQQHGQQLMSQEPDKALLLQKGADQSQLHAQTQWRNQQQQLWRHVGDVEAHQNSWSPQGAGIRTAKGGLVSPQSQHAVQAHGMSQWQHNKTLARSLGPVGNPNIGQQHDNLTIPDAMATAQLRHKQLANSNVIFPAAPEWKLTA